MLGDVGLVLEFLFFLEFLICLDEIDINFYYEKSMGFLNFKFFYVER